MVLVLDKEDKITDYSNDEVSFILMIQNGNVEHFLDFYQEIGPTILTGWNIDYFGVPYLYRRLTGFRTRMQIDGSYWTHIIISSRNIVIAVLVAWIILLKNFTFSINRYRLDAIGRKEVGISKVEYEGNLDDLFSQDIGKFIEYNLNA